MMRWLAQWLRSTRPQQRTIRNRPALSRRTAKFFVESLESRLTPAISFFTTAHPGLQPMISEDQAVLQLLGTPPTQPANMPPQIVLQTPNAFTINSNQNVVFQGNVIDENLAVATLQAIIDNNAQNPVAVGVNAANGTFTFTTNFNLNNVLGDDHTVVFQAIDSAGLTATTGTFNIRIDTVAPNLAFDISAASDTLPRGDGETANATISLTGTTSANAFLTLANTNLTTTADANGAFTLNNVPLVSGPNTLGLTSFDAAGNSTSGSIVITRVAPDTTAPSITGVLASDTGSSSIDLVTSNPTINLTISDPQGVTQYTFAVDNGTPAIATFSTTPGTFTFNTSFSNFTQGLHTLQVTATDSFGNVGSQDFTINFDNVIAPSTTFDLAPASDSAPTGDQTTTLPTVTLAGSAEPNATVTLTQGNLTTTADGSGVFQFSNISLPLGNNTFDLTVSDAAGNQALLTRIITRIPDTAGPNFTGALTNDTGPGGTNSDQLTSDPAIGGTLNDVSGIQTFTAGFDSLAVGSYVDVTADRQANGNFSFSFSRLNQINGASLTEGPHVLHLIATDIFGNQSTFDVFFNLDTAVVPTPSVALNAASDTGVQGDNTTSLASVTFTGTTEANATVTIQQLGLTTTANGSGNFTFSDVPLALGNNSLFFVATDTAGNQSVASRVITRVNDTAPSLSANLTNDAGVSNSDQLTNDPSVVGSVTDSETSISTFQAGFDSTPLGSYINVLGDRQPDGSFSFDQTRIEQINSGPLAQGARVLHLIATDTVNNSTTFNLSFQFDNILTPAANLDLEPGSDTAPQGDDTTTLPTVTLIGTAEANSSITLTGGFATQANSLGNFQFANVPLNEGPNTLTLTVTDPAGNGAPTQFVFTRDQDITSPSVSASLTGDTGFSNSDGITNLPVVSGTVTDLSGVGSFRAGFNSAPVANYFSILAEVQPGGSFSLDINDLRTINGGSLDSDSYTLHLIARDIFNNESTRDVVFTYDAGVIPIQIILDPAFQRTQFNHTNDSPVTVQGSAENNSSLTLSPGNVAGSANSTGQFAFSSSNISLNPGNNTITITSTDAAGNSNDATAVIVLDTVAPVLTAGLTTDTGIASDGITSNPSVNGSLTDVLSNIYEFRAGFDSAAVNTYTNILGDRQVNGSFSLDVARINAIFGGALTEGSHTLHLRSEDGAGNTSTLDIPFTLDTTTANPTLDLDDASDTGADGDLITSITTVTLVGTGENGATIELIQNANTLTTTVASGTYSFSNITLQSGANNFTVQATDIAGNQSTVVPVTITLSAGDFDAPVVTADLANDSGMSDDNITNDASVSGTVTDATAIATFSAGFDTTLPQDYVSLLGDLSAGAFSLDMARLEQINGVPLAEGFHVLYFQASDGTTTATTSITFFLDSIAPAFTDFGLDPDSDTGSQDTTTDYANVNLIGITEPGLSVTLNPNSLTEFADNTGRFGFDSVPLSAGNNTFALVGTDLAGNTVSLQQIFTRTGANLQIVSASNLTVAPLDGVSIPVLYDVNPTDNNLSGIGVRIHYDSSKLTFGSVTNQVLASFGGFSDNLDSGDLDGDLNTTRFISIEWDDAGNNWPNETLPTQLFVANFDQVTGFTGSTELHFTFFSAEPGYITQGLPFTVSSTEADPAGEIHGTVYFDANADGDRDAGENGMPGMQVFLDLDQDGNLDDQEPVATTDSQGAYSFLNIPVGTYFVVQPMNSGLLVISPFLNSILNPDNIVGTVPNSPAHGFASASVDTLNNFLSIHLFFDGLVGIPDSLTLRRGTPTQNGPVAYDLTNLLIQGNTIQATIPFDVANDYSDLASGLFYIELTTDAFLDGELRGQLTIANPSGSHLVGLVDNSILTGIDFGNSQ